jgi:multicopper oxidase
MNQVGRRALLLGGAGAGALVLGGLGGCGSTGTAVAPSSDAVRRAERARRTTGQRTVAARLSARPAVIDLGGGQHLQTWTYGDTVPGPLVRAQAGDLLRVTVDNELPSETSVHWHGIALRNDMDGVPGMTGRAIAPQAQFTYEFTVPDPGTYFYHPHSGVQLDRGLYGVLIVDDPREPGDYDVEWVVVLDDWLDGTGRTPDEALQELRSGAGAVAGRNGMGMGGMDHGSMGAGGMVSPLLGGAGEVDYPYYLVNGCQPIAPAVLRGRPGQRARLRIVNAASDTAFRLAIGDHRMTVTHSDGFPVKATRTDAVLVGMGERFDVSVTLKDGVFPLVADAEGKNGAGLALVRTASGQAPDAGVRPSELTSVLVGTDLRAEEAVRLTNSAVDRRHDLVLGGTMVPYRWTINGSTFPESGPLSVRQGERVRLRLFNHSMMFHPMHVHGHTFALVGGGPRKDTVIVRPMQAVEVDLDAVNPGQWATHCHNAYHMEAGMMTTLSYRA